MVALEQNSVVLKSHKTVHRRSSTISTEKVKISFIPNVCETQVTTVIKNVLMKDKDKRKWSFQYRYLIVLMEFFAFFQISCLRQVTSVSIVAMVNNTEKIQLTNNFNSSLSSCPLETQEIEIDTIPEIEGEFDWSPSVQGYILSASFLGYVLTQMPGGLLAEAFGAKYIITFGLFISSFCHFISPIVSRTHSYLMIFFQFVRGFGQGLIPAAHCVVVSNWFPRYERGPLNTLVLTGFAVGSLVGGMATGSMCSSEYLGGWSFSYYFFGGLGIFLSISYHYVFFETPRDHPKITDVELKYIEQDQESDLSKKRPPTPWRQIFHSVPVYALTIGLFPQYWVGTYGVSVLPTFLGTVLHVNVEENGVISSLPFILQAVFAVSSSLLSNWLQKNNYAAVDTLRKGFHFSCFLGYTLSFIGMYASGCSKWMNIGMNMLQSAAIGLTFAGAMIVPTDMSPRFAGSVMGLVSTISSVSGFLLPVVVGLMTNEEQTLDQWNKIFFMSAGMSISAAIIFCVFGSAEVQPWNFDTKEEYDNYKSTCKDEKAKIDDLKNDADTTCHV